MVKPNPRDASRARLKAIAQEIAALDREREILERFLTEYETFATQFEVRAPVIMPGPRRRRLTVPALTRGILEKEGHPLTARELVARLAERGKTIGGKDRVTRVTNLSSMLSPHNDFVSVRWSGTQAWWLAGRELPSEPTHSGGKADQEASAKPQTMSEEGNRAVT